jgi:hypothetical protein
VNVNGRDRVMELREIVDAGTRQIQAQSIDPEIFGQPLPSPRRAVAAIPAAVGPVQVALLDLPTVDDSDPPVLLRAALFADPWPGPVSIWQSGDGASFTRIGTAFAPAIMGETLEDFPAGPTARYDRGAGLHVRLYGGALSSLSESALLAGGNPAAVRNASGAWEIVQFGDATLVGPNEYRLTRLLRGQSGSDGAIAAPLPAGAPFVFLDGQLVPLARGLDSIGRPQIFRFVAADRNHGDPVAVEISATPTSTGLRPFSPVHLRARRSGAGVTISWIRRARRDGDAWDGEVPLGEDSEAYAVDILSGMSVVRTLTVNAPSVLYAVADELADFGAAQTTLSVRVAQLSATVGRGFETRTDLTL